MRSRTFKQSFGEQLQLTDSSLVRVWTAALIVFLLVFPFYASPYLLGQMTIIFYTLVGALGLTVLTGFTGLVSLGNVAFMLLGAYAYAVGTTRLGLHPLLAFVLAGIVPAIAGLVVGIPSLRLKGLYLAITTLAFTYIVNAAVLGGGDFTGGARGIMVPRPVIFGVNFASERVLYWFSFLVTVLTVLCVLNIRRTRLGRAFIAIRDNDRAAVSMGISLTVYKLLSFTISSFIVGLSGALMVLYINFANTEGFPFLLSIEAVAILIIGGIGSVLGTIFGAVFIVLLPEAITRVFDVIGAWTGQQLTTGFLEIKGILYGAAIVLFLMLEPRGLVGMWLDVKRWWVNRPLRF